MCVIQDHIMFTPSSDLGFIIPYSDKGAFKSGLADTDYQAYHTYFVLCASYSHE